jgi:N utilization substance protein B
MQALFQLDQNPSATAGDLVMFITDSLKFPELEQFCKTLLFGTSDHQRQIDQAIATAAINWKIERMAAVDRAILRLGVFEMIFAAEPTPARVVITEAVEIAKRFSTNESARFVNGILDRVARLNHPSGELPTEAGPPETPESEIPEEEPTPTEDEEPGSSTSPSPE